MEDAMKLGFGCFGLTVAALVAIPVAVGSYSAFTQAGERIAHPNARYQLTLRIKDDYYISDHDLTLDDCLRVLESTEHDPDSLPLDKIGRYTCDRQPEVK
jgi:hypothetical protein